MINEKFSDHAKAFYRGIRGQTHQGNEPPGKPIKDSMRIVPGSLLDAVNELGPKGRQALLSRLQK